MEDIGPRLRAAREARGISLLVAEEETKIRRKYIEALEEGRIEELPGEVYLKGFLRTYGNYLGLDGEGLVTDYKLLRGGSPGPRRAESQEESATWNADVAAARPIKPDTGFRPAITAGRTRSRRVPGLVGKPFASGSRLKIGLWLLATLAVVGYLGWLVALQFDAKPNPASGSTPVNPPVADAKAPEPVPAAPAVPPAQVTPKQPDPPKVTMTKGNDDEVFFTVAAKEIDIRLEFDGVDRLWMQAIQAGAEKPLYEGFPTEALQLKGANLRLRMGHMNGVSLVINGQRFDKPLQNGPYTLVLAAQP